MLTRTLPACVVLLAVAFDLGMTCDGDAIECDDNVIGDGNYCRPSSNPPDCPCPSAHTDDLRSA